MGRADRSKAGAGGGKLRSDLAIDNGDAAATMEGLLSAYAEARLLRHSMFVRMVELGGPITAKGKARALFGTYLKALDRERRLALDLGLRRVAKSVPSVEQYVREQAAKVRREHDEHENAGGADDGVASAQRDTGAMVVDGELVSTESGPGAAQGDESEHPAPAPAPGPVPLPGIELAAIPERELQPDEVSP